MNLLTMNWLTRIIAVSQNVADSIRRYKPNLKADLQVIWNGVNIKHFAPGIFNGTEIRQALAIPGDAPVIGTIAVFRSQKRLDIWVEVAHKILASLPNVHFIIVGDGPLKSVLMKKRDLLGLQDRIHFVGLQTEVRPYIAAFDIYMMSSVFEGLPIALLETMASGCAVISTDAGGIKEVIRHEVDGMLCSVEKPEDLTGLAISLLGFSEKCKLIGLQGRSRIEAAFSMEKMVKELEILYNNEVDKK